MKKLTKQTIKPVLSYIKQYVNSRYYHFTLDTYNGKNSFQGGTTNHIKDCYHYNGKPLDAYAIDTVTGEVVDLNTKTIVMTIKL